jgi:DNA-binding NtrC family response regulator
MPTILIIEDEAKMRRLLELNLGEDGFKTLSAGDAETGLKLLASEPVQLVLTDLKLPGMNGLEFLQTAKQQNPALPIVVMTAFGSVETAVDAMKAGATDYVLKPFSLAEMRMVVHKELDNSRLRIGRFARRWDRNTAIPTSLPSAAKCRRCWLPSNG